MDKLVALVSFAFVGSVTPGPNNSVLWASGLRFGFQRTVPHVLGTALGICTLPRPAGVALVTSTLMVVVVASAAIWAAGGAALNRMVDDERRRRLVSIALAILLAASVWFIWI